ncbi:hypothetical protein FACS1894151_03160 [Spirochaetia bacterium]|nr:hypothetical protein FACS1894151_03160 [Spirochaetia bacterium]
MVWKKSPGKKICFVAVLFLLTAITVYAGGARDNTLERADALIAEYRYAEAIDLLMEFAQKGDDNFAIAQKRLQAYMRQRDQYNERTEMLLDVLENDPGNSEMILALTEEIRGLQGIATGSTFLDNTQELAQFTYNRARLENILAEGHRLAAAEEFGQAMNIYAGGMDIYQDEFFTLGYGESVEQRTRRNIENVSRSLRDFNNVFSDLEQLVASLAELSRREVIPSLDEVQPLFEQINIALNTLVSVKGNFNGAKVSYDMELASLQVSHNLSGDRSFLSFASRLLWGHDENGNEDGMLGALDACWNSLVPVYEVSLAEIAGRYYTASYAFAQAQEYQMANGNFTAAQDFTAFPVALAAFWRRYTEYDNPRIETVMGTQIPYNYIDRFLQNISLDQSVRLLARTMALAVDYEELIPGINASIDSWRSGLTDAETAIEQELGYREQLAVLISETSGLVDAVDRQNEAVLSYRDGNETVSGYLDNTKNIVDPFYSDVVELEKQAATWQYTIQNGEIEKALARHRTEFERINLLMSGIVETSGESIVTLRYPSEALVIINDQTPFLAEDIQEGNRALVRYRAEAPEVRNYEQVAELYQTAVSMVTEMESMRTRERTMVTTLRTQIAQAEAFRIDAERLFRDAQSALQQSNFTLARDRIVRAGERYDASLAIQESETVRRDRDTTLVNFGMEISRLENEIIIREVRQLVNNARNTYYAGNFEQAEDMLVRAQNRWRVTNIEDDDEVTNWLRIVRGALSLRSGRTIPTTAPLYAEMSQLLSDAHKLYDEGVSLINRGRRPEGIARLNDARQKTREVRLMFPINQDASLLEMQIEQVIDPAVFNASFQGRLTAAIAGTKRRSVESFADLQTLAVISPRYPGIQSALNQAEIDMGYRPVPPNPADLARSNELVASARMIIDRNNRAEIPIAMEQLNQALLLNPSNNQAMSEKDRAQTILGGTTSVVLSNQAEQQYQRAVRELQNGNTVVAMAIVQQLLQDPNNRNSTRLLELQRRIESIL